KTPGFVATVPSARTLIGRPFWPSTWLPRASVSVPCGERMNWPLRVKRTPCGVRSWKKPVPSIAKSSGSPVSRTEAGGRSVVVRPGMMLAARVAETHGSRGLLMIANAALAAELPAGVKAGDTLKLRVQEATSERIVMRMETEAQQQFPVVPLPGGQSAHIEVD